MKAVFALVVLLLVVGFFYFFSNQPRIPTPGTQEIQTQTTTSQIPETVDIKASFAIFTNGTFRIFTASKYHNLSDEAYIDASNPNVINVKKANITWDDFFKTLPMKLAKNCLTTGSAQTFCNNNTHSLKFYVNGVRDPNALDKVINNGDTLLVSYGPNNDPGIENQLEQVSIK